IVALIFGQGQNLTRSGSELNPTLELVMMIVAAVEFVIGRAQDYVLAGLIGLLASLLVPTRQSAASIALMGATAIVLIRALITAVFIAMLTATTVPTLLLMVPVGPASPVVFALSVPLAIIVLLAFVVIREGAIRLSFSWLLAHLAGGEPVDSASIA